MRHDVLLCDTYCAQYEGALSLLKDKYTLKSSIIQYITQAVKYNKQQKKNRMKSIRMKARNVKEKMMVNKRQLLRNQSRNSLFIFIQ